MDIFRHKIFQGMTEAEVSDALAALRAREQDFLKGSVLFTAGTLTSRCGLVLSGSVTIESNDFWGNRTILSHAEAGEIFAETYALLPDSPMLVDVIANEDCRILFLSVGPLIGEDSLSGWQVTLLKNLLDLTARKNLALSGRSFHTAPKTVRGRVMSYLNAVALQRDAREFDIPFDRQQLADYLNLDRSALSKELGRMRDEGILQFRKNHFILRKTD